MIFEKTDCNPIDRRYLCKLENQDRVENILTLGSCSYNGDEMEFSFWEENQQIQHVLIGRFCSLAKKISFLIGGNHSYKNVTTFPFDVEDIVKKTFDGNTAPVEAIPYQRPDHFQIVIGHDVWIGRGVTIMGGVKIGNGAVIGANAVVAKDIPPYAIAVGNPARVIKYRFDAATIKKFLAIKWWNWDLKKIADNVPLMNNVEKFLDLNYTPELEEIPEDTIGQQIAALRKQGCKFYNFIADFRAEHPLWIRVVLGFCRSNFADSRLVIWLGKDSTEHDFELLAETAQIFGDAVKNIIVAETQGDWNFMPYALKQGTHFITTREMTTLEALDYLWDTNVKIVSALDEGIFDGEPLVEWQAL